MNTFAKTFAAASLAAAVGFPSAHARVLGFGTNVNSFDVTGTAQQPVPLKSNGATTVTFKTSTDDAVVVVTYNAECAVVSDHIGDFVLVWITVDGVDADVILGALCSALVTGTAVSTAASHRALIRVPKAGSHTVRVFANLFGGTSGHLDDSSIVIED